MSDPSTVQVLLRKLRSAQSRLRSAAVSQRFGFSPSEIYNDDFYDGEGCEQGRVSASTVANVLHERLPPHSAFDFGCRQGALIEALAELGVEVAGCEGSFHGVRRCSPASFVFQQDLKQPVALNRQFDLTICIEVAEHLPARSAATLVESIAAASAKDIVFSASGPGELGDDHINLQPKTYWVELFEKHGFVYREAESAEVREAFTQVDVPDWFQNTVMLAKQG